MKPSTNNPSHLRPEWDRFKLSEAVWGSIAPTGNFLVLYEPATKLVADNVLVVLRREEVDALMRKLK